MNQTSPKKTFTVGEVNQRLPLLRAIVSDIVDLYQTISARESVLTTIRSSTGPKRTDRSDTNLHEAELKDVERELEASQEKLQGFERELRELGGALVDAASGVIEFPAVLDGREVFLSWTLGEDEIAFWHNADETFLDRKSLLEGTVSGDFGGDESDSTPTDR